MYCSKNDHYPDSQPRREHETYGQTAPQAGLASHPKPNSQAHTASQRHPSHPRVPDRGRGRAAGESRHQEPLGSPGRHDDARGLSAWFTGIRAGGLAVGPGGLQDRHAPRAPGQAGHTEHPSDPR